MRVYTKISVVLIALGPLGCGEEPPAEAPPVEAPRAVVQAAPEEEEKEPPPPPPSGRPVVAYRGKKAEAMTEPEAIAKGLTVIDLSNYWVPHIFSEQDRPDEEKKKNGFRSIYRKLANNWPYEPQTIAAARQLEEIDKNGPLKAKMKELRDSGLSESAIWQQLKLHRQRTRARDREAEEDFSGGLGEADNFLEVYGILPTLSVLRKRAVDEIARPCLGEVDYAAIRRLDGMLPYESTEGAREASRRGRRQAEKMRAEMKRLGVDDPRSLLGDKRSRIGEETIRAAIQWEGIAGAQKLLECEGLFRKEDEKNYWSGGLDWKTHQALLAFEHKNRIFGWGVLGGETLAALNRTPAERLFDAFARVLEERIADATGVIEDGSARDGNRQKGTYIDENGQRVEVPNLLGEYTAIARKEMDLDTPDKVIAFLRSRDDAALDTLYAAVAMPKRPPYYGAEMDLHAVIDRGDVWYDYPYDSEGRALAQPRKRMPMLTLYTRWNGQDIPLVTMNTTVGGWRSEQATDGYVYFKYKGSDVGPRVWKDIVAGPVWLPPDTTPIEDLVKKIVYHGRLVTVPNYDEFGPWYASAYGLVAAFHLIRSERRDGTVFYQDKGFRTHGSVDYNSILRRFSHGCHRLYNHLAIRLFDFVLKHRAYIRAGQMPSTFSREFTLEDERTFVFELNTKGYRYELVNPVPVEVLEGEIKGKQKVPIEIYMPKPGVEYGDDAAFLPPEFRKAAADAGAPESSPAQPGRPR